MREPLAYGVCQITSPGLASSNRVGVALNTVQSVCTRYGGVGKAPDHFIGSPPRPV